MRPDPAAADYEFDLWIRFKSGDKTAFAEIYECYAGVLYNYGFHISSEQDIVEDAIQDLFVVLWQSRENLSDTTSIKYYLFRSLRRQIVKLLGKETAFERYDEAEHPLEHLWVPSAEMLVISGEAEEIQWKELQAALMELTPRQLEAIRLHFYEGFDFRSISLIMEMNEQSVRNILHRSLYKLRHVMQFFPLLISLLGPHSRGF